MQLPNTRGQKYRDLTYDASGTIASGGTAQLILPERLSTSFMMIQNISDTTMYFQFGCGFATASLTNGVVSSVAVVDAGAGFTYAPVIEFLGGGQGGNGLFQGPGQPGYQSPSNPATAVCNMTGSAGNLSISTISVTHGGSRYIKAPYVQITNDPKDPNGYGVPSATRGFALVANGGSLVLNGTACTTDPLSVFCASSSKAFTCKWML